MMLVILLFFISLSATGNCNNPCTQPFVDSINSLSTTWTAKQNFRGVSNDEMPNVCDSMNIESMSMKEVSISSEIPSEFDARTAWSHCSTIRSIYKQGKCGSCWAFATSAAMSDRICIFDREKKSKNVEISPQNLVTCCAPRHGNSNGCKATSPVIPFLCWIKNGIVTEGCQPYELAEEEMAPPCSKTCVSGYDKLYSKDLHYGKDAYRIMPINDVKAIQSEIMKNGPITVLLDVYDDFMCYSKGVYKNVMGEYRGKHAVKMIGWGEENGVPYWWVANSWSKDWGTLGGFFKIMRGVNAVQIEQIALAGIPLSSPTNEASKVIVMFWAIISLVATVHLL